MPALSGFDFAPAADELLDAAKSLLLRNLEGTFKSTSTRSPNVVHLSVPSLSPLHITRYTRVFEGERKVTTLLRWLRGQKKS